MCMVCINFKESYVSKEVTKDVNRKSCFFGWNARIARFERLFLLDYMIPNVNSNNILVFQTSLEYEKPNEILATKQITALAKTRVI